MSQIQVYSTGNCPWCARAKSLLRDKGLDYQEIDVSADQAWLLEMIERSGRRTVPQIFIDERSIGGFVELSELNRSGKLDRAQRKERTAASPEHTSETRIPELE